VARLDPVKLHGEGTVALPHRIAREEREATAGEHVGSALGGGARPEKDEMVHLPGNVRLVSFLLEHLEEPVVRDLLPLAFVGVGSPYSSQLRSSTRVNDTP